jgi:hypothetical protein
MAQGKRNGLSTEQRTEMWRRWKAGESLHEIGRAFGKGHGSIRFLLTQRGGIVPAARRRSPRTLTLAEREDISRGIASGSSIREIASGLQRPVSTVSREGVPHGRRPLYGASEADRQAWESALRPKVCFLANHETLRSSESVSLTANYKTTFPWRETGSETGGGKPLVGTAEACRSMANRSRELVLIGHDLSNRASDTLAAGLHLNRVT